MKAEILEKGPNTRFVVTTRSDPPDELYHWYTDRGESENRIKDLKNGCFADRLSCHHFMANQFRLLLHAAAYWLLDTLRRWLTKAGVARMTLETLQLRLIKIGGWARERLDRVRLRLATSHPNEGLAAHPGRVPPTLVNKPGSGPSKVEEIWREDFDGAYEEGGDTCHVLTMHPRIIGRHHRMRMLELVIKHIPEHDNVWFAQMHEITDDFRSRQTG